MAALRRAAAIAAMAPKKRGGAHRLNTQIEKWEGAIAGGELPTPYNTLRFTFLPGNHRLTLKLMCVNEAGAGEGGRGAGSLAGAGAGVPGMAGVTGAEAGSRGAADCWPGAAGRA